jgi:hypothetical protein
MITKRKQCGLSDGHSLILEQTKHALTLTQDSGTCRTALRLSRIDAPEITAQCNPARYRQELKGFQPEALISSTMNHRGPLKELLVFVN